MTVNKQGTYEDGAALRREVEAHGDLLTVSMEDIRRAHGRFGKLGPHVQIKLAEWLANEGMAALPQDLKRFQQEEVRVYRAGTDMAAVIEAVLRPGERGDKKLREIVSAGEPTARSKLDEIRAIVED